MIDARVIDAFAGTGALGLEALSRGAAHASFIERDPGALKTLRSNIARLGREADAAVISGDATNIASWRGDAAGLLLADAPYGSGEGLTVAARLAELGALAPVRWWSSKRNRARAMTRRCWPMPGWHCWMTAATGGRGSIS